MKLALLLATALLLQVPAGALAAPKASCDAIDAAISANEDFAETVLGGDAAAAKESLAGIHAAFTAVRASLPTDTVQGVEARLKAVDGAVASGDATAAAVDAIEIYRLLTEAFEKRLPTTLDVAMLDYSGFRLHGLAAAAAPDWGQIDATVAESAKNWASAAKRVKDKVLLDLGGSVQAGLEGAAVAKNLAWLNSLAQIQLDSVDLLERAVKNTAKGACQ